MKQQIHFLFVRYLVKSNGSGSARFISWTVDVSLMLFGIVEQHFSPSSGRKLEGKREGSGGKSTNRKPGEANPPIGTR
jgi:hypothetical protein